MNIEMEWILHEQLPISRFEIIRVVKNYSGLTLGQMRIDNFEYEKSENKQYDVLKLWACLRHFKNTGRVFFKNYQTFEKENTAYEEACTYAANLVRECKHKGLVDIGSMEYTGKLKSEDIHDWIHTGPEFPREVILRCINSEGMNGFDKGVTYCGIEISDGIFKVENKFGIFCKSIDRKNFRVQKNK